MSSPALHPPGSLKNDFITENARAKPIPLFKHEKKDKQSQRNAQVFIFACRRLKIKRLDYYERGVLSDNNILLFIFKAICKHWMAAVTFLSQNDPPVTTMCLPLLCCPYQKIERLKA